MTMDFLSDQLLLCFTTSSGGIFTFERGVDEVPQKLGMVSEGISGGGWSPDLELFVVVSSNWMLYLMNRELDVLDETPLHPTGSGRGTDIGMGRHHAARHPHAHRPRFLKNLSLLQV